MCPPSDIHARVLAQYSEAGGATFYRIVMGDGGAAIHYGHYTTSQVPMRDAVRTSTAALLEMAARHGGGHPLRVIDLGAGSGGSSHQIAAQTAARITCVDLCADLNADNLRQARADGLGDQIETWQGSFDALPAEWSASFDQAWSQDALCHAPDKPAVFREIHRVLKSGGLFVFSDILRADGASAADVAAFTGVNAVDSLASPAETRAALDAAGFELLEDHDWSDKLRANFAAMLVQIERHRAVMIAQGVSATRIDGFARSLERRLAWSEGPVMCWAAFACRSASR
jgi:sarcosine/dimethylglycine N-methyltransferase